MSTTLTVETNTRTYPIHIGAGAVNYLEQMVKKRRVFVLVDANAYAAQGEILDALLPVDAHRRVLPNGEAAKTYEQIERTLDWMLSHGVDRRSLVIAFGGGVVGDHAGFAASVVLRGVDFVQVPTTLLSQVDSSVGGKTGINTAYGKNLVGSFYQPVAVLSDTRFLSSLPDRELRAGYAEVIKYGAIGDRAFLHRLDQMRARLLARDAEALREAVATSCAAKAKIVGMDEREETGARATLNFGHTFGHALESLCTYDERVKHGEAVAVGMCLAAQLSVAMGLCPAADAHELMTHIAHAGLPTRIADIKNLPATTPDDLIARMGADKKNTNGTIRFILLHGLGQAFLSDQPAPLDRIHTLVSASL